MLIRIDLKGTTPLLMHNQQLANPLSEHTLALAKLTAKRKKTIEDHKLIMDTEYLGGLYINGDGPYVPSTWVTTSLHDAAKVSRDGPGILRSLFMTDMTCRLDYPGPRKASELVKDENFRLSAGVCLVGKRLTRTRPMFSNWSLSTTALFDPEMLDFEALQNIAKRAGQITGMGDWRPAKRGMYGKYTAEITQIGE